MPVITTISAHSEGRVVMIKNSNLVMAMSSMLVLSAGCSTIEPQEAFHDVALTIEERTGKQISWDIGSEDDMSARAYLSKLLSRPLTPDSAVQIALLNNRQLQAAYADVGIAQASLVQAGMLKNPILDGAVTWYTDAGGTPNFAFGLAWSFIDLLYIPLRTAVAQSELEEAKIRIAGMVVEHASKTQMAFLDYVAARQEMELFGQVVKSTRASLSTAKALRKAGNITALQLDQEQVQLTQAKLELAQAEVRASEVREKLNVLMGLSGNDTEWHAPTRLPEIPSRELSTRDAERHAIERSLDIEEVRQRLITLGRRFHLVKRTALFPELDVGFEYEREVEVEAPEDGGPKQLNLRHALGPTFGFEIPIFDRGEAKKAGVYMQVLKSENELWDLAIRIRSAARLASSELLTTRKTVSFYRRALLPQTARVLAGTQKEYNAMQEDVFRLLAAKRQQIRIGRQYIGAIKAYWMARANFQQLMSGKLPDLGGGDVELAEAGAVGVEEGGH